MTDPAAIARALTKAQQRIVLLALPDWATPKERGVAVFSQQAITNASHFKVIEVTPTRFRLTPLGVQVKALLEARGVAETRRERKPPAQNATRAGG